MIQFVDTHSHLYDEAFSDPNFLHIHDAIKKGVSKMYMPNIDSTNIEAMLEVEKIFPQNCFSMMGLHPCYVKENFEQELQIVKSWLDKRKFTAIGEIGLDYFWDKTYMEQQKTAFTQQIYWALEYNYPIVIHCRKAFDDVLKILEILPTKPKGIFHCFSGSTEEAKRILNLKTFKIGIGGVITFKNSGLQTVIEQLSLHDIVLETDAPYLAPVPHRGKTNQSAYIPIIAEHIAFIKNTTVEEVARITTQNSNEIFE